MAQAVVDDIRYTQGVLLIERLLALGHIDLRQKECILRDFARKCKPIMPSF